MKQHLGNTRFEKLCNMHVQHSFYFFIETIKKYIFNFEQYLCIFKHEIVLHYYSILLLYYTFVMPDFSICSNTLFKLLSNNSHLIGISNE